MHACVAPVRRIPARIASARVVITTKITGYLAEHVGAHLRIGHAATSSTGFFQTEHCVG